MKPPVERETFVSRPLGAAVTALALVAAAAVLGEALAGDDPFAVLAAYEQPWFALPDWGWILVGVVYSVMLIVVVFRLLRRLPPSRNAIALVVGVLLTNELWNVLVFGMRALNAALVGIVAFAVLVLFAVWAAREHDKVATVLLALYALWVIAYDISWTLALVILN